MTEAKQQQNLPPQPQSEPSNVKKSSKGLLLLVILVFLIALAASAAAGYLWWLQQQTQLANQQQFEALQAQLQNKAERAQIKQLSAELPPLTAALKQQNSQAKKQQKQLGELNQSVEKLFSLYARDRDGWMLAEVEYLLRIAQHRLLIETDFEGAVAALKGADERLAAAADPGTLRIRVIISKEIGVLKSRQRPDIAGMHLTINRLLRQAVSLKPGFHQPMLEVESTADSSGADSESESEAETSDWAGDWQRQFEHWARNLVNVQKQGLETEAEQTESVPMYRASEDLQQQLRLAQWALLERDQSRFQQLLGAALQILHEHYDQKRAEVADFSAELKQLQQLPLKAELPDISKSLQSLRQLIASREQQRQAGIEAE